MSNVSISTGCLPRLEGSQFYDLFSVIGMMNRFLEESELDGFEFVLLPEWDSENPPLTPSCDDVLRYIEKLKKLVV